MEIGLSEDQELLRATTRKVLEDRAPVSRVRELFGNPEGFDRTTWRGGADLGWYGMFVPEELGGGCVSGNPLVDACLVAEEMGRMLHPGPALATNVVADALARAGSPGLQERHLGALASGERIGTWAFAEPDRPWTAAALSLRALPTDAGYALDGGKTYVQDAHAADLLLVSALAPEGPSQFLIPRDSPGIVVEPLETLDLTRRLATVRFSDVQIPRDAVVGTAGDAAAAIERQLQVALVLQCAETVGATARGLEMTVRYAKERVAFGRPIGSFQALKHRMADHRTWLEASFATTAYAAAAVGGERPDAAVAARVAKAHVARRSTATLHDCVQLHGGIGMTWEYDLHLYFRKAISNEVLYGGPAEQHRFLVDLAEAA